MCQCVYPNRIVVYPNPLQEMLAGDILLLYAQIRFRCGLALRNGVNMITLEKVSKFIIKDLSLHIPKGECVGLIGASGAGKTTLLKLICGLLKPQEGYVRTLGKEPITSNKRYGRALSVFLTGYSPLESADTVRQVFELLQSIYQIPKEDFEKEYEELASVLDFGRYQNKPLKSLSLGQRMRVELAATLIGSPKLILLDEPNVGLDENGKAILWEILQKRRSQGATILVASHSLTNMEKLCSRMVILEKGQLLYYGSMKKLLSQYAPVDRMEVRLLGELPDMEDLPIQDYRLQNDWLQIHYNSNYLSAAEILQLLLVQTQVEEVNIRKPDLTDIILQIKGGKENEYH